jgi:hypothetical protein
MCCRLGDPWNINLTALLVSEYTFGNYLLRVEGGVIEQFSRKIGSSYRVPVTWAAAEFENRKHDVVRVSIGVAAAPTASFFSSIARANLFSETAPRCLLTPC